jgi:tetratricopeptide (TPR) repeat protein
MDAEIFEPELLLGMDIPEALSYLNEHIDRLTFKLEERSDSVELYLKRAELYLYRSRTEGAIETPMMLQVSHNNHTYQFAYKENYPLALADLQIALQLDATNAQSYFLRASIHSEAQNYEEGILDIAKAIELQ